MQANQSSTLNKDDIKVGRVYQARKLQRVARFPYDLTNDRQVLYVTSAGNYVQYDSPTVGMGRHYPTVPMEKFLKWVGKDVTDECPKDEWRKWSDVEAARKAQAGAAKAEQTKG